MRVSLIGFGLAGRVFHAPFIHAVEGLELTTIVTSNAERAEQARREYPQARAVASADEAWDAELVVVATPNDSHLALALEAIRRDIAVVVDKPFAPTVAQAEELIAAGGRATVFQSRRWDGDFLTLKRIVDDGALGEITTDLGRGDFLDTRRLLSRQPQWQTDTGLQFILPPVVRQAVATIG